MTAAGRFGDLPLVADTTVWAKLHRAPADLVAAFRAYARDGLILGSPVVRMEWLHDAQNGEEFDERDRLFGTLRELALTRAVSDAALGALRDLRAQGSPGYHRVGLPDALIAATAAENGVNVLHDNPRDYDKLAEVLEFEPVRFDAER